MPSLTCSSPMEAHKSQPIQSKNSGDFFCITLLNGCFLSNIMKCVSSSLLPRKTVLFGLVIKFNKKISSLLKLIIHLYNLYIFIYLNYIINCDLYVLFSVIKMRCDSDYIISGRCNDISFIKFHFHYISIFYSYRSI